MLIPQYPVLVLKLSPIYTVSLNTVFSIPQNQCYPGTPCTAIIVICPFGGNNDVDEGVEKGGSAQFCILYFLVRTSLWNLYNFLIPY